AVAVDHRNHVGGVFGDQLEKLVAVGQFTANALQLKVLPHRVNIEDEHQGGESADPLFEVGPVLRADGIFTSEEREKDDTRGEGERHNDGEGPKPPLAAFDLLNFERWYSQASGGSSCRLRRHSRN